MKIIFVSKCSLDIEQFVKFKMSILISPSKSLINSRWVTYKVYRMHVLEGRGDKLENFDLIIPHF